MNSVRPTISVIVPVYNVEPYLHECVDSILSQTFTDFELILVDDGSPDNCGAICDEYAAKDSRIVVIHQENGGLSAARNAGIDIMRGEHVTFVDSDDLIHSQTLERYMAGIGALGTAVACCNVSVFKDSANLTSSDAFGGEPRLLDGLGACEELCRNQNWMNTVCNKLFPSALFRDIRFPCGKIHEDEAVMHRVLFSADRIVMLPEKLYCYRKTPNSITNSGFSIKRYDRIAAFEDRYAFFCEHGANELAKLTRETIELDMAKYSLYARLDGVYGSVPAKYKISKMKALRYVRDHCSEENYLWWLSQFYPKYTIVLMYFRKICSLICGKSARQ